MPTLTSPSPAPWRTLLFILAAMFIMFPAISGAHTDDTGASPHEKLVLLSSLAAADYIQSSAVFFDGDNLHSEINPLLGEHPSRRSMAAFGIIGVSLAGIVADRVPGWVIDSIIATELLNVQENQKVSNGMHRDSIALVYRADW